ncbi:MAG: ABC transporter permease [Caldilineaceae bacterium]
MAAVSGWVKGIVTEGKFGYSFAYRTDAGEIIMDRLPKTLMLALLAHLTSTIVGVAAGIYVALRQYGAADNILSVIAFILTSLPRFFIALVIMYILVFTFNQHHLTSFFSPQYAGALVLGQVCGSVEPYLACHLDCRTRRCGPQHARHAWQPAGRAQRPVCDDGAYPRASKRPPCSTVHAVPNALHPMIAYQGTVLPYMVQGELEAAIVMGIPTLGPILYQSLVTQDIYLSAGALLMLATLIVLGNLIADVLLAVFDPRIRYS